MSADKVAELLRDYADPEISLKELEVKYRVHSSRIYAELQKAGIRARSPNPSFKDGLDDGFIEKFVEAYANNDTIEKLSEQFGLNYDQVYVLIRENGLRPRHTDRRNAKDPEFRSTLAALYADATLGVSEVAARMGIGVKTLSLYVIKFNLPRRGKGGGKRGTPIAVTDDLPRYAAQVEEGISIRALAEQAGVSESTLRQKLKAWRKGSDESSGQK